MTDPSRHDNDRPHRVDRPNPPRHAADPTYMTWQQAHELTFGVASYAQWVRLVRMGKYGSYATAAAISYFYPSLLVSGAFTNAWTSFSYVWSTILLLGAIASFLGVLTRTWVGEYIGLYGVIAALALYAFVGFTIEIEGSRVVLGFLALGFTFSAVARRQDVSQSRRLAEYTKRLGDDGGRDE